VSVVTRNRKVLPQETLIENLKKLLPESSPLYPSLDTSSTVTDPIGIQTITENPHKLEGKRIKHLFSGGSRIFERGVQVQVNYGNI